jgi:uncharacterized protein YecT (DUF1311 family)
MSLIRKIQIAWLTWRLRALIHDIAWARLNVRHHINTLRKEIRKTEQRLITLTLAERQKRSMKND